jgi:hypothetical protein
MVGCGGGVDKDFVRIGMLGFDGRVVEALSLGKARRQ